MQYKIHMGSQLVHCNFFAITFILLQFMVFFKSVQLATKKLAISYVAESLKYVTCMLNRSGYGTESRS